MIYFVINLFPVIKILSHLLMVTDFASLSRLYGLAAVAILLARNCNFFSCFYYYHHVLVIVMNLQVFIDHLTLGDCHYQLCMISFFAYSPQTAISGWLTLVF